MTRGRAGGEGDQNLAKEGSYEYCNWGGTGGGMRFELRGRGMGTGGGEEKKKSDATQVYAKKGGVEVKNNADGPNGRLQ